MSRPLGSHIKTPSSPFEGGSFVSSACFYYCEFSHLILSLTGARTSTDICLSSRPGSRFVQRDGPCSLFVGRRVSGSKHKSCNFSRTRGCRMTPSNVRVPDPPFALLALRLSVDGAPQDCAHSESHGCLTETVSPQSWTHFDHKNAPAKLNRQTWRCKKHQDWYGCLHLRIMSRKAKVKLGRGRCVVSCWSFCSPPIHHVVVVIQRSVAWTSLPT